MQIQPELSTEVANALDAKSAVVALESTVISHGLPYPENLRSAEMMTDAVRSGGSVPAVVAMIDGVMKAGISGEEIERLASEEVRKLSVRDLAIASAKKLIGATTVATTSLAAHSAGIRVFATGGIGGVHRGSFPDVSADLPVLASTPMTVVCSGAKSVLDLAATREWLETYGIPIIGYGTDELPAFYTRSSGLSVDESVDTAEEAAEVIRARDKMGMRGAVLVAVPVPQEDEIDGREFETWMEEALKEASSNGISGKDVTPFLLGRLSELSEGRTLKANISLLVKNAAVASELSVALASST